MASKTNVLNLVFFAFLLSLVACRDEKLSDGKVGRKIENIQDRIPIGQETLFVGDSILPCDDCREGTLLVLRAPFKVLPASAKKIKVEPGSALSRGDIVRVEFKNFEEIRLMYQNFLRQARDSGESYFWGEVLLRLKIERNGNVEKVVSVSSSTHNPLFDKALTDFVASWKFPEAADKTIASFPISLRKTGYSGNFVEISRIHF